MLDGVANAGEPLRRLPPHHVLECGAGAVGHVLACGRGVSGCRGVAVLDSGYVLGLGPTERRKDSVMERVVVIGTSGSGKSTLADRLAQRYGLTHLELDAFVHGPRVNRTLGSPAAAQIARGARGRAARMLGALRVDGRDRQPPRFGVSRDTFTRTHSRFCIRNTAQRMPV